MKHLISSTLFITLFSAFTILGGLDEIVGAIKRGDSAFLSRYFDNTVDLTLPNKTNSYSKSQAQMVLRDFFTANPVQSFEIIQQGQNNSAQYCIGQLKTAKATFITTILLKSRAGQTILQELRIEKK